MDQLSPDARVIVAIDGPDAAGKTTLADTLAQQVARPALRVSIDDWHNPREVRLRRGDESPVGYYMDSFDYEASRVTFCTRSVREPAGSRPPASTSEQTHHQPLRQRSAPLEQPCC